MCRLAILSSVVALIPLLIPSLANADPAPVIGGTNAPAGAWPDVAAILYDGNTDPFNTFECSGVLVAPTVVLTAGHCDPHVDSVGTLTGVLVGTSSLSSPGEGETIAVGNTAIHEYPSSQSTIDITVITLPSPAKEAPRADRHRLGARRHRNGAKVEFVGYGATDQNGNKYIPDAPAGGESTITDFDCTASPGCNAGGAPGRRARRRRQWASTPAPATRAGRCTWSRLRHVPRRHHVAGVRHRDVVLQATAASTSRPDKIVDWIEQQSGVTLRAAPSRPPIRRGRARRRRRDHDHRERSEDRRNHTYAITTPPAHGTASVRDDGGVRVCTRPDAGSATTRST